MATESAKTIAWQTALYLIVAFAFLSIVVAIIIFVGRVDWTIPTPWRTKMESRSSSSDSTSTSYFPSPYTLVEMMLRYFSTTFLPAFGRLRTATTSSMGGALSRPRPQPPMILPLFTAPPGFREPVLTPPRPAMPRDTSSFRVPSNPYSGSSGLPASLSHSNLPSPAH